MTVSTPCCALDEALASNTTYHDLINVIVNDSRWDWTYPWWRTGCVVVGTDTGRIWEVASPQDGIACNISQLGCSGHDENGSLEWIGFDLDVGHGSVFYPTADDALKDAYRLREALGEAEIRRSKSGNGIHVRHLLPLDCGLKKKDAPRIAKFVARKLELRADPAALGRQVFWLWAKQPNERSFESLAEQDKAVFDLADIIVEALAAGTEDGAAAGWAAKQAQHEYDPDGADDSVEAVALAAWKPGDFQGRSPLGGRNWADMRYLVNDWGMTIPRAAKIITERGGNPHPSETQWRRMMRYCKYPAGWARRKHERQQQLGPAEPPVDKPVPDFPLDVLPQDVRAVVETVAWATQVPQDLPAQYCLAVLALGASKAGVKIEWKAGLSEPANLYLMTTLAASEHKSSALKPIIAALREMERVAIEDSAAAAAKHESEAAVLDAQIDAERRKIRGGNSPATALAELLEKKRFMQPPRCKRYLLDDVTPESLCTIIAQNGAIGMIASEAGVVDNMSGRYSPNGEGQIGPYLKLWDGEPFAVDRKSRSELIQGCLLTIGCTCQPTALQRMTEVVKHARGLGLLSRFLFSVPQSRVGIREVDDNGFDQTALAAWNSKVRKVFQYGPRDLQLSAEAREVLRVWRLEIEQRLAGDLREIADWAGKIQAGQVCRLAAVLHVAADNPGATVDKGTMENAVKLARYYIGHALAAFASLERDPDSELGDNLAVWAETIIGADGKRRTFTMHEIVRRFSTKKRKKNEIEPVVKRLVDIGVLKQDKDGYSLLASRSAPNPIPRPTTQANPPAATASPMLADEVREESVPSITEDLDI